eukprot:SAG31_NODE_330_length_17593_cov_4.817891_28_plen_80_part_00
MATVDEASKFATKVSNLRNQASYAETVSQDSSSSYSDDDREEDGESAGLFTDYGADDEAFIYSSDDDSMLSDGSEDSSR